MIHIVASCSCNYFTLSCPHVMFIDWSCKSVIQLAMGFLSNEQKRFYLCVHKTSLKNNERDVLVCQIEGVLNRSSWLHITLQHSQGIQFDRLLRTLKANNQKRLYIFSSFAFLFVICYWFLVVFESQINWLLLYFLLDSSETSLLN